METTAKAGPPTSATSDFPEFKSAPVDDKPKKADTKDTEPEKVAGESPKSDKDDGTPTWLKREITIERNKRRAAEERQKQLEQDLSRALEQVASKSEIKQIEKTDPRPQRFEFDDPDLYDQALIDWSSRKADALARAEETAKIASESQKAKAARVEREWNDRRAEFMADNPDFSEVVERDDLQISTPMAQAILESDIGPAVSYWLGKNPEESARIAALEPMQAFKAIGRIEARLSAEPSAPAPRPKPEPIKPVGSRGNAGPKSAADESMEEYAARRAAELRKR